MYLQLFTWLGGGEYGIYYLVQNLNRNRFQPVVMFNKQGPFVDKIEELGVETVFLPYDVAPKLQLMKPASIWRNLKASFIIRRFIVEHKIDIVQCSDVLSLLLLFPAMISSGVPVVFSLIFKYKLWRAILVNLFTLFGIKKIVSLSQWILDDLFSKTIGVKKKSALVYWAINAGRFKPVSREERDKIRIRLNLPTGKKIVGFVGRFDVWKGHMIFVNAAKSLVSTRSDLLFLIVGDAITKEVAPAVYRYYRAVVDLVERYKFDGHLLMWQHREDIPDIMACLDVFVCPSENEPFGLVILEAMATGLPVVASDSGGPLEIIENGKDGFLFRTGDPQSLQNAITVCVDHPDMLSGIRQAARKKAETGFTLRKYAADMEKIYDEVVVKYV